MAKKILVAGLFHETHTFLSEKTTADDFRRVSWHVGEDLVRNNLGNGSPMDGFLEVATAHQWDVIPAIQLAAMPSGIVQQEVVSYFNEVFFAALNEHIDTLDGIFLVLHGAMVSTEMDDVEGELLEAIQEELRKRKKSTVPVVGILDLHANVSEKMIANSSCLYAYRKNPHTDAREAAVKAAEILSAILDDSAVTQVFRSTRYILPPAGVGTDDPPMKHLLETARQMELSDSKLVCINIWAGYAYADIEACGFSLSCCTRGEPAQAQQYLSDLEAVLEQFIADAYPKDWDLERLLQHIRQDEMGKGPVLLIEAADNIGGGTPGDGTGVLAPLLAAGVQGIVAVINDPEAVSHCTQKALGETITVSVGAKTDAHHGAPVLVKGIVRNLSNGRFELENKNSHLASLLGDQINMGPCAVLVNEQLTLLLTSFKTPPMDLGQLHSQGVFPEKADFVIVKAAVSHRQAYDPIASKGYFIDSPGLCTSNLTRLPYRKTSGKIVSL